MNTYQRSIVIKALVITELLGKGVKCGDQEFILGYQWMGRHLPEVGGLLVDQGMKRYYTIQASEAPLWEMTEEQAPPPPPPPPPSTFHLGGSSKGPFLAEDATFYDDVTKALVFPSEQAAIDYRTSIGSLDLVVVENLPDRS